MIVAWTMFFIFGVFHGISKIETPISEYTIRDIVKVFVYGVAGDVVLVFFLLFCAICYSIQWVFGKIEILVRNLDK